MNLWLAVILIGIFTYAIRLSFILLFGRIQMPANLLRVLRYVPPTIFAALVFPELVLRQGQIYLSPGNFRLIAGVVAGLVAWRTKNVVLTILAGMGCLLLLQAVAR